MICRPVKRKFLSVQSLLDKRVNYCISLRGFLVELSRWSFIIKDLEVLAEPAGNQKPNQFKVLGSPECVHVRPSDCVWVIGSSLVYGPKAMNHELSPLSISIQIRPDSLPDSSVRGSRVCPLSCISMQHNIYLRCCSLTFSQICIIILLIGYYKHDSAQSAESCGVIAQTSAEWDDRN